MLLFVDVAYTLGRDKSRDSSNAASDGESMNRLSPFVGIDRFKVQHVANDVILIRDAIAAEHVARIAGDAQRRAAGGALYDRDELGSDIIRSVLYGSGERGLAQAAHLQHHGLRGCDVDEHVGEAQLDDLIGREGRAELLAVAHVASRRVKTSLRGAQRAPSDAEARGIEARKGARHALCIRQHRGHGEANALHDKLPRGTRAQRKLTIDTGCGEALGAARDDEAAHGRRPQSLVLRLGPHNCNVAHGRVRDPHFGAINNPFLGDVVPLGPCGHSCGVAAVIGFGQAEGADDFAASLGGEGGRGG